MSYIDLHDHAYESQQGKKFCSLGAPSFASDSSPEAHVKASGDGNQSLHSQASIAAPCRIMRPLSCLCRPADIPALHSESGRCGLSSSKQALIRPRPSFRDALHTRHRACILLSSNGVVSMRSISCGCSFNVGSEDDADEEDSDWEQVCTE